MGFDREGSFGCCTVASLLAPKALQALCYVSLLLRFLQPLSDVQTEAPQGLPRTECCSLLPSGFSPRPHMLGNVVSFAAILLQPEALQECQRWRRLVKRRARHACLNSGSKPERRVLLFPMCSRAMSCCYRESGLC